MATYLDWIRAPGANGSKRLFYFTSPVHVLDNLRKDHLKISNFGNCNDLFELASFDLRNKEVRQRHIEWVKKCQANMGLMCFTENWRNQLMWGHYAQNGTGVCLVVDVAKEMLRKVNYVSLREEVDADYEFPEIGDTSQFFNACLKKHSHWSYESEHRLFVPLKGKNVVSKGEHHFLRLGDEIRLVGFINGPQPLKKAAEIQKAFQGELKYFQCRSSFREFEMVVQQTKSLWN